MKGYKHNWKKESGYTLKQAKEMTKKILGRLPHCGYETCFHTEVKNILITQEWDNKKYYSDCDISYWLVNESGTYRIRVSTFQIH